MIYARSDMNLKIYFSILSAIFALLLALTFPEKANAQVWPEDLPNPKEILPDSTTTVNIPFQKFQLQRLLESSITNPIVAKGRKLSFSGTPQIKLLPEKNLVEIELRDVKDHSTGFEFSFVALQVAPEVNFKNGVPHLELFGQVKSFWALNLPHTLWKTAVTRINIALEGAPIASKNIFELKRGSNSYRSVKKSSVWVGTHSIVLQIENISPSRGHSIDVLVEVEKTGTLPKTRNENSSNRLLVEFPVGARFVRAKTEMHNQAWPASCILPPDNNWRVCAPDTNWCSIGWARVGPLVVRRRSASVRFYSWSHCNERSARLSAIYEQTKNLPGNTINFELDSDALNGYARLNIRNLLSEVEGKYSKITIIGHTDSAGNEDYNNELSIRRAKRVKEYLVSLGAISSEFITIVGSGANLPVDSNRTVDGQWENRRVHIYFRL